MRVQVHFYAELARSMGGGERQRTLELPPGTTVGELLTQLGRPPDLQVIVGLNGALVQPEQALAEGDTLELMTAMEGG
jgi:thiamine biosynthesis protein ThiS